MSERWAIDPASDGETTAIYNPDTNEHICIIQHASDDPESGPSDRELRNAHMLAAAPLLYEACKAAASSLNEREWYDDHAGGGGTRHELSDEIVQQLRAALAAADG